MIGRIDGVLCCGNICYDIPVWPVTSVAWGRTVWVDEITFSVGGNGSNTSYSLATLGAPVRLTGMVGRDFAGEAILAMLEKAGVQSDIHRSDLPTACTSSWCNPIAIDRLFQRRARAARLLHACSLMTFPDSVTSTSQILSRCRLFGNQ